MVGWIFLILVRMTGEMVLMAGRRVLLVEDSSTMRRMISSLLTDQGYDVKTAVDGKDGLIKAEEEPRPELILSDFEMPEMDGPGLCARSRPTKSYARFPCSC